MTDKQPAPVGDCHIVGKAVVTEFSELEAAAKRFHELMLNASMACTGKHQEELTEAMEAYRQASTPSVILSLLRQNAELKAERDALATENAALKAIIQPIANEHSNVECTDRPVWYVCDPRQMMSPSASALCSMFHGPFWSRERATEFMESTSYRYGNKASVYCTSLYHYPEMRRLYDASKNLKTPATDAAIAEIKAQGRTEGIQFAANRILAAWKSGFINDTPGRVLDISGAVLSAVEFLPNASPEEFKRDYADEVRAAIAASLRKGGAE